MLSTKSIQRLYKPTSLQKLPLVKKLRAYKSSQISTANAANDTNLSRDQVLEIYDWIAQLNAESNSV